MPARQAYRWVCEACQAAKFQVERPTYCPCGAVNHYRRSYPVKEINGKWYQDYEAIRRLNNLAD